QSRILSFTSIREKRRRLIESKRAKEQRTGWQKCKKARGRVVNHPFAPLCLVVWRRNCVIVQCDVFFLQSHPDAGNGPRHRHGGPRRGSRWESSLLHRPPLLCFFQLPFSSLRHQPPRRLESQSPGLRPAGCGQTWSYSPSLSSGCTSAGVRRQRRVADCINSLSKTAARHHGRIRNLSYMAMAG
ncbi:hypothetical protein CLAIMM_00314, partial [Cladophialophora immunda]